MGKWGETYVRNTGMESKRAEENKRREKSGEEEGTWMAMKAALTGGYKIPYSTYKKAARRQMQKPGRRKPRPARRPPRRPRETTPK